MNRPIPPAHSLPARYIPPSKRTKAARPGISYMTVEEVAAEMRVSRMTVYRLVHANELEAVRIGRSIRIPEAVVDQYIRDSMRGLWESEG